MEKKIVILICILICGCKEQPKLPVSNNLEIALGNKYSNYVNELNKAFQKDTTALIKFLEISYINDAAGYDHGFILFQLMKENGDKNFAYALTRITYKDLNIVRQYFEVGIDANDKHRDEIKIHFPLSSEILQLK